VNRSREQTPRVSYLFKWVERGIRIRLDEALAPLGISTPEYTALSVLGQRSAQAMNQLVIGLERRGLITRTADLDHRKIQRASLTPAGRQVLAACDRASEPVEDQVLSGLSGAEVADLRRLLSTCVISLQPRFDTRRSESAPPLLD
jgi:hypothetical protein